LKPAESKKFQPETEKTEEIRVSLVSYPAKKQEPVVASKWVGQRRDEEEEEEESCKCCCGYNSESQSCCSNPEEVILKSGKATAATQIPSTD
jgi:hypothetical protein